LKLAHKIEAAMPKRKILLKITGEVLAKPESKQLDPTNVINLAQQIKQLSDSHYIGIVIGGGNFFRGSKQGTDLGLTPAVGHQIGMIATMMNGLIVKDLFEKEGLASSLFCAVPAPEIGAPISDQAIKSALAKNHCVIFSGGTGNPFFSTDTTAVLRGLQISADEVWKATDVDGIYTSNPATNPNAQLLRNISYAKMLKDQLKIMDSAAIALAQQHNLKIRVFNVFEPNALLQATKDESFGSTVTSKEG
jgi:uridylate kinase